METPVPGDGEGVYGRPVRIGTVAIEVETDGCNSTTAWGRGKIGVFLTVMVVVVWVRVRIAGWQDVAAHPSSASGGAAAAAVAATSIHGHRSCRVDGGNTRVKLGPRHRAHKLEERKER